LFITVVDLTAADIPVWVREFAGEVEYYIVLDPELALSDG
jgi:hypothetical protein